MIFLIYLHKIPIKFNINKIAKIEIKENQEIFLHLMLFKQLIQSYSMYHHLMQLSSNY